MLHLNANAENRSRESAILASRKARTTHWYATQAESQLRSRRVECQAMPFGTLPACAGIVCHV